MSRFQFTWGDTVLVASTAPLSMRPGAIASVCGMREATGSIDSGGASGQYSQVLAVYLVEFGDGFSIEIPEQLLEPVDETQDKHNA